MNILYLIPARGGSKGLPGKNIKLLNGKPMIAYTIEAAIKSNAGNDGRVFVTTDDEEIMKVSMAYGAEIIDRPPELAADDTPMAAVIAHAMKSIDYRPDIIVLLQPTSPLRHRVDIDNAMVCLVSDADVVMSVTEPDVPTSLHVKITNGIVEPVSGWEAFAGRRQDTETTYQPNGAIYVIDADFFRKYGKVHSERRTVPYYMERMRSVDVDTYYDFKIAEYMMGVYHEDRKEGDRRRC